MNKSFTVAAVLLASSAFSQMRSVPTPLPVKQGPSADGGASWEVQGEVTTHPSGYYGTLFGHTRSANPYTLGDIINTYGIDTEIWGVDAGGGSVTASPLEASIYLRADGGLSTEIQTHRFYRYQAGRQQTVLQTAAFLSPIDAGIVTFGNVCVHDGLYWRRGARLDVGLEACRRNQSFYRDGGIYEDCQPVDAGVNFNFNKGNIYEIRYAWLGVHQVDWYLNGVMARSENFDGRLDSVYMSTATLPIYASAQGKASLKYICTNITSEGGQEPPMPGFSFSRPATKAISAAAGILPIVAIRMASSIDGVHAHSEIIPESISCQSSNPGNTRIYVYLNPATITNASWANVTASTAQTDVAATAFTGGTQVCTFGADEGTHEVRHAFGQNKRTLKVRFLEQRVDTLLVAADSIAGNLNVTCAIEWGEVR